MYVRSQNFKGMMCHQAKHISIFTETGFNQLIRHKKSLPIMNRMIMIYDRKNHITVLSPFRGFECSSNLNSMIYNTKN